MQTQTQFVILASIQEQTGHTVPSLKHVVITIKRFFAASVKVLSVLF